jgi:hypothetical protein
MSQTNLAWFRSYLEESYRTLGFENLMGLEIVELTEGKVIYKLKVEDKHQNSTNQCMEESSRPFRMWLWVFPVLPWVSGLLQSI